HRSGNGSQITSESATAELIYSESFVARSAAANRERQLKHWTRAKKLALVQRRSDALHRLAKRRRRTTRTGLTQAGSPTLRRRDLIPVPAQRMRFLHRPNPATR